MEQYNDDCSDEESKVIDTLMHGFSEPEKILDQKED